MTGSKWFRGCVAQRKEHIVVAIHNVDHSRTIRHSRIFQFSTASDGVFFHGGYRYETLTYHNASYCTTRTRLRLRAALQLDHF